MLNHRLPASPSLPREDSSLHAMLRAGVALLALEAAFGGMILLAAQADLPQRPVVRIALATPVAAATRAAPPRALPFARTRIVPKPPVLLVALPRPGLADWHETVATYGADRLRRAQPAVALLTEGYGFEGDEDQTLPGDPVPPLGTVAALSERFAALDYTLAKGAEVPSLFLDRLPADLAEEPESARRKAVFLRALLPLIVKANDRNLAHRAEIERIDSALAAGAAPDGALGARMNALLAEYRLDSWDTAELMRRADMVPPSLALAQAATESGWGRSSFARDGNALFGQREFVETEESDGKPVPRLKRFDDLAAAVDAYVRNLNTYRAYADFRRARAGLRAAGTVPSGPLLANYLDRYSEQGSVYTALIKTLMRSNDLAAFDRSKLRRAN